MRRASKTQPISPQQLKHFAAGAGVLTGLLALFASGEDWGAKAKVDAMEAKNRLAAAQAEKLGTKKALNSVAAQPANNGEFGDSAGADAMGNGESQPVAPLHGAIYAGRPDRTGPVQTTGTVRVARDEPRLGAPITDPKAKGFFQRGVVDKERAKQIRETSKQRTGSTAGND